MTYVHLLLKVQSGAQITKKLKELVFSYFTSRAPTTINGPTYYRFT